jgi:protein TonB
MNARAMTAIIAVVAIHAALLVTMLTVHDTPTPRVAESRTITAELLSPAPLAAPIAIRSAPMPLKPVPHVPYAKPKVQSRPVPRIVPATTPLPEAGAPSPHPVAAPEPAAPTPAARTTPAAPASPPDASTAGRPTIELAAPQDISHLNCSIAEPAYPALSRRRGETGTATVKFIVGLSGRLESIELKSGSGYSRLDDAALAAVRDSTCKPYLENGAPRRVPTSVPFVFSLNG